MNIIRFLDMVGLTIISGVAIYGTILTSYEALLLIGLTIFFYINILFSSGFNGTKTVIISAPLMILLTLAFAVHVMEAWVTVIAFVITIRVIVLMVQNIKTNGNVEISSITHS